MTSRVLVTGSHGLLGQAVIARLRDAGHGVVGLDPLASPSDGFVSVRDDLSDHGRLHELLSREKISHIIHAGGVSGPMVLADQPERVIAINVGGTFNLVSAAQATGVKTFLFCSSVSAVGDFHEAAPIDVDYPLRPTTAYGCSKAAVDMMLRGLWRRAPMDVCSLRFTAVYGPGRTTPFVIDEIVAAAIERRAARVEPMMDWNYVYVDDAADAIVAACFSDRRRQLVYFIAYPEQVSVRQLAQAAGDPAIEIDAAIPEMRRSALDIAPARRDFDFDPKVDHREGIRRVLAARRSA